MKSRLIVALSQPWSGPGGFLWASALTLGALMVWLAVHPVVLLGLIACIVLGLFAMKSLRQPLLFVTVFLTALILLPPIYWKPIGETPIYVSTLLLPVGLAVLLLRLPDFHSRFDPIARGLIVFLLGTAASLPCGWWLSGAQIGNQSFLRWLMLAQSALIYFLVRGGARRQETRLEQALIPVLVVAAALSAAYGIIDFIWPVPYPHPAADEYIWLRTSIVRRAQGVFYEAGNFSNLCAFCGWLCPGWQLLPPR